MRYILTVEKTKGTPTQYCVYDTIEDRVIVRYAKKKDAQDVIDKYKATVLEEE